MPIASLPELEQRLEACLLELEKTHRARPGLPTAMARAEAGQRVDVLFEQMVELQEQIDASPTETLQDAAVKLRRLSAYVEDVRPTRLLAGALSAVERAAEVA
jgi:non-ribosomal peptide synthetase component F